MTSFSIIIPVWNQQEFLPDAIESALEQSFPAEEVFVINDGSPDNSSAIAHKYPVKVIDQVNKGLSGARNAGIMNATAEYCLMLDADDQLMPNCLEMMDKAITESEADIIAPSFKHFGVFNEPLILTAVPTLADFKVANRLPYFSAIRREALLECGGYSPRMTFGWEDYHLWLDLLSRGKTIHVLRDILVLYRTKEHSMITEANKHSTELLTQMVKDFPHVYSA